MAIALSSESGREVTRGNLFGEPLPPFWMRSGGTCCRAISIRCVVEQSESSAVFWVGEGPVLGDTSSKNSDNK